MQMVNLMYLSPAISCLAIWSAIFRSCIFTPRDFAGPPLLRPTFSVAPYIFITEKPGYIRQISTADDGRHFRGSAWFTDG